MQRCAFTPYEGEKPYIFISYAHKDAQLVFPVLEELDRRGYRVWYDDGIAPGSEWPENIAQHLDGCSLALAFISPNSIASANCRREITFALAKHKPFLGIMLQETEMSLGMELQLSAQQCIMKYTYATDEAFFRKLCSCPDLEPCLDQSAAVAAPVATPVASAASVADVAPAPPAPRPKAEKKPINKKLIGMIAGAAAAVLIAVGLACILGGGGSDGAPSGFAETALSYSNQTITHEDVSYINQQTQLQTLEMHNCVIQDNALDSLNLPDSVTAVSLKSCEGIGNLNSLLSSEKLVSLTLVDCGIADADLIALSGRELQEVNISGNPDFTDLEIFANCTKLEYIDFSNTGVSSLEGLAEIAQLYAINGSYTKVKDLTVVANMTTLREVSFAGCDIETIETPFYSLHLETLDLSCNKLKNLSAFTNCGGLKHVNLSFNALFDADVLGKSAGTLESLNISGNSSLYSFDLDFLNSCTKLRQLVLDGLNLGTLSAISELEGLEYLSAVSCSIKDISSLQKLTNLQYLNLALNRISDISVLAQVANESMTLDLSFNNDLTDVSTLPAIRYSFLNLLNTKLNPHTVPAVYGEMLLIYFHEDWLNADCMNEDGRDVFAQIVMIDCPLDKVVAMENRFGDNRIQFVNEMADYLLLLNNRNIDIAYLTTCVVT